MRQIYWPHPGFKDLRLGFQEGAQHQFFYRKWWEQVWLHVCLFVSPSWHQILGENISKNHIKIWSLQFNVKFNTQIKHRKAESAAPNLWLSDSSCWVRTYTRTIQLLPYLQELDTAGSSACFDLADFYTRRPSCNPQRICVNFQPGINPGIFHLSCKCANLHCLICVWFLKYNIWL